MKKTWKKLLAAGCALSMFLAVPGMTVKAEELHEDAAPIVDEAAAEVLTEDELLDGDVVEPEDTECSVDDVLAEESIGAGKITVGDGVTATFNKTTGAVEFYSNGGELWSDWIDESGFDVKSIKSIRVASGTVYLPEYSDSIFAVSLYDDEKWSYTSNLKELNMTGMNTSRVTSMYRMFAGCSSLTTLNLSGFNTSKVTDTSYMFEYCSSLANLDLSSFDLSKVEEYEDMFYGCYELGVLKTPKKNNKQISIAYSMKDDSGKKYEALPVLSKSITLKRCLETDLGIRYDGLDVPENLQLSFEKDYPDSADIILRPNNDEKTIKNIRVALNNANHVQLDPTQIETLKNGFDLKSSIYMITLLPKGKGAISGTLSISADGYPVTNITLSGNSNYYDTERVFRMVKYVPSSYVLTASSGTVTGIEGKLPKGISYIAANNELYGAPTEKGEFVIDLVTSKGTREKATIGVLDRSDFLVRMAASEYSEYWGFGMPGAEEVGKNIYAFMSAEKDQAFYSGGAYNSFVKLWLNGKVLTKGTDYTVANDGGSTKITLKSSVLKNKTNKITKKDTSGLDNGSFSEAEEATYGNTICAEFNVNPSGAARGGYMRITPYNFYVVDNVRSVVNEGFSDVQDPTHAFYNAIYWASDAGITKGYPDGTFGIDRSCTRGEMIMFLWRYAGKPAPKALSKSPFKDVPKTHAFYNAIIWASQKGITKGYPDGTFGINRNVSRGECMMFLWRLRGKPAPKAVSVSPFKDVSKTHAFYNAILWGAQKKITNGYTSGPKKGTFGINENCTRGAIVTFLYRAK